MNIDKKDLPKPFLKWVGGKQKHIQHIINGFPKEMNNYREPFLGGGSVLLALLWSSKENLINITGDIFAYDLNESLIHTYENVLLLSGNSKIVQRGTGDWRKGQH